MKLLSLNRKFFLFFILLLFFKPLLGEESVDIWKKKDLGKKINSSKTQSVISKANKTKININAKAKKEIELSLSNTDLSINPIYGIYDPNKNNLNLDMWTNSEGTRVKDTIDRIKKITLSSYAEEIFVTTLFTISNLPGQNMTDKEFMNYKLDWLIDNKKDGLISIFLNMNKDFPNKSKVIKYLVDKNIAKGNLKKACEKIELINSDVQDAYLDQFKVICFITQNKKDEAQLLFDLLREQKLSNKFFDKKINYLLGITDKEDKKIDDTSLLNFYLSSITVSDFNYIPQEKTDMKIWQFLNASDLIKTDDFQDKEKIKQLEIAVNSGNLEKSFILEIYKKMKFEFNDVLNIDEVYQTLDPVSAKALVYQKTLLSDKTETKLKYLFLLDDLFKKDNLPNIFKKYLDQELKVLDIDSIPEEYQTLVAANIIHEKKNKLGKIKYNDKSYHTSKAIKYYVSENFSKKSAEKELRNTHKKLKKNKKYKITLKDIIFLDALKNDNFLLPQEIDYKKISEKNIPPAELMNLVKNNEVGLALLRIVELIGEDEISDLDFQTIYFINYLFTKAGLTKFRNEILISVLPERAEI